MSKATPYPHCGSDKEACFSRVDPMGFYCPDCGKDVDVSPEQARFREKLERERDELLTQLAAERALADRLGEAARIMWSYIEEDLSHGCLSPDYRHAIETYGAAFTAWKEARSE